MARVDCRVEGSVHPVHENIAWEFQLFPQLRILGKVFFNWCGITTSRVLFWPLPHHDITSWDITTVECSTYFRSMWSFAIVNKLICRSFSAEEGHGLSVMNKYESMCGGTKSK